jgi:hypothetical protein
MNRCFQVQSLLFLSKIYWIKKPEQQQNQAKLAVLMFYEMLNSSKQDVKK